MVLTDVFYVNKSNNYSNLYEHNVLLFFICCDTSVHHLLVESGDCHFATMTKCRSKLEVKNIRNNFYLFFTSPKVDLNNCKILVHKKPIS